MGQIIGKNIFFINKHLYNFLMQSIPVWLVKFEVVNFRVFENSVLCMRTKTVDVFRNCSMATPTSDQGTQCDFFLKIIK